MAGGKDKDKDKGKGKGKGKAKAEGGGAVFLEHFRKSGAGAIVDAEIPYKARKCRQRTAQMVESSLALWTSPKIFQTSSTAKPPKPHATEKTVADQTVNQTTKNWTSRIISAPLHLLAEEQGRGGNGGGFD